MEFKEVQPEEIVQHEHPLILEDLQSMYQNYLEDDDDVDDHDLITMQNFECICNICGYRIDWYHRYYYKCSQSCSYSLHKSCGKLSKNFQFVAHPTHTLHLKKKSSSWSCRSCLTKHQDGICYHCSTCDYKIDLRCATFAEQTMIYHPGHPHPLISITLDPTLSKCYACGREHKGVFYHCNTCFYFSIHIDCVTLPFKLTSNHHVHMLTLTYSFSVIPYHSKCRICGTSISEQFWLYKCTKCRVYIHLDCATSRGEPFMSIFSHGLIGKTNTNFEAADYTNLLHYPLPDESYNILPHHILREDYDQIRFNNIHSIHNHPLLLINSLDTSISTSHLHNPMMRIKLLCDGCSRPISTTPYYVCSQAESGCGFYLHERCTRLPSELENHPGHPQHTLFLFHSPPRNLIYTGFKCNICGLFCNGFGYACTRLRCNYRVDVHCGFVPERILHEAHPNHLLSRVDASIHSTATCNACAVIINGSEFCFRCSSCDFYLHFRCALHLPGTIKNKYDRHPLKLSYSPIENHKSEYFCEVCEEELIPEKWFYHCQECGQSIHSACAPLILRSEQGVNSLHDRDGVYKFLNIKFGGLIFFPGHPHPYSFIAGANSDGRCFICAREVQSLQIFKCFTCNVALHAVCTPARWMSLSRLNTSAITDYYFDLYKPQVQLEHHETATVTFYPSQVMRPVTMHWNAVNGQL
ncbi:putative chromatin regulator PHD family [Helianthus annuus]|nr:putative chromatin regulator PHD family [Helianthus annuus]